MSTCVTSSAPHRRFVGIVFDLDGTLIDSYVAIAASVNAARRKLGLAPLGQRLIRSHVGRGLQALMHDLVGPEAAQEAVAHFREHYAQVFETGTRVLPGVLPTLAELAARGYRMAVASNKPARFGRAILERFGLVRYVVTIEGPDTCGVTKPSPEMLERCLEVLGVPRERCLYVGDMPLDVQTAARAGVEVVLVASGSAPRESLRDTGKTVLDRLDQLPQWIEQAGPPTEVGGRTGRKVPE